MFPLSFREILCLYDVQFNELESYFSKDVDMVPIQGEINSKEEERLW